MKSENEIKILIGLLTMAMILFAASIFDSNRVSTLLTGILAIMFSIAIIVYICFKNKIR